MLSIYDNPDGLGAILLVHNKLPLEFILSTAPPPAINDNVDKVDKVPLLRLTVNEVDDEFKPI